MTDELNTLQTLRLKGRISRSDLATSTAVDPAVVSALVDTFISDGLATEANGRVKPTPSGRERLASLLDAERAELDVHELDSAYHEFDSYNVELKVLMTRWQLKDGTEPNDHSDGDYDGAVVADLRDLHERFSPLLDRILVLAPRLRRYPGLFASALAKVEAGDSSWFARPIADSYHTVWFELHEELIGLTGRTRADEAVAGRAL